MSKMTPAALLLGFASSTLCAQPAAPAPRAPESVRNVAPALADYTDRVLFGEVWPGPGLTPRDRSIVVISSLIAGGRSAQLTGHVRLGLDNGLTTADLGAIITHLAFYGGWPNAVSAASVADEVFKSRGLAGSSSADQALLPASDGLAAATVNPGMAEIAPALGANTKKVLLDDLWRRADMTPRDRSLATIAALITIGDGDHLAPHIRQGLANGLTQSELAEAANHLAFYAGWPRALAAVPVLNTVFAQASVAVPLKDGAIRLIPAGANPSVAPPSNFTGSVLVDTAFQADTPPRPGGGRVTFQPRARTNWHSHALGQTLIVTAGSGFVQAFGEAAKAVKTGDVIWTPAGVKHWHGAGPEAAMTHFGIGDRTSGVSVVWLEAVSDAQYEAAVAAGGG